MFVALRDAGRPWNIALTMIGSPLPFPTLHIAFMAAGISASHSFAAAVERPGSSGIGEPYPTLKSPDLPIRHRRHR